MSCWGTRRNCLSSFQILFMQAAQLAKAYKTAAVSTQSPGAIILMMMDGALACMDNAIEGFTVEVVARRNETVHNNLTKAYQILAVLQAALDLDVEGEFPQQMHALYEFMMSELMRANLQKVEEPVRVVRDLFREIRDAWNEMLRQEMAAGQ